MKLATLAAGLILSAGMAAAQNAEVIGTWKTQPDDNGNYGTVEIAPCGNAYCGVLTASFNGAGQAITSEHTGKRILWDMVPNGGGEYSGGKIYAPDRDRTYNSKMSLAGNNLSVSGCVLGICRSQAWTRQ